MNPFVVFAWVFGVWFLIGAVWTYWKCEANGEFDSTADRVVLTFCGGCMGGFAIFFWWLRYDF